jgi:tetratricopeptide (TPR) repeat protein/predicted Ser/Thr protein kinase
MSDPEKEPQAAPRPVSMDETRTAIGSSSSSSVNEQETWVSSSVRAASGALAIPTPGQTLADRYMVFELLGQGGMGVVLAAYDKRLDRRVALKLLRSRNDEDAQTSVGEARLVREAQAMARLNHPNVVAVYDAGTLEDGSLFIAMEYVEGQTLRRWRDQQPRPWREVLDAYLAAGRGLIAAHAAGLIHRDFKPDNVLVGKDGRVRVTDFGLARPHTEPTTSTSLSSDSWDSELTIPGTVMGTPKYMAPELMRGEAAGVRSDLFAFCVALYEALYGQLPFPAERMAEYSRARREGRITPPPAQSEVPTWVARTVLQGLQANPHQRPASLEAVLTALQSDPEVKRRAQRRTLGVASAGVVLAALALWGWVRQHAQEPACGKLERRLDGIWDTAVKARVHSALLGTGLPYAADTAERVSTSLNNYAGQWVKQSTALCEAEQAGQLSRLAALRESCLERRRSQLHATTELLARGADPELLEKAAQASQSLPPLEDCADDKALTAAVPLPEDPAVRAKVKALQEKEDRVEALLGAGKYKEGLAAVGPLLREVEAVDHAPLHAQVLFLLGSLRSNTGDYSGAETALRGALTLSAQGKDLALMSRALTQLMLIVGVRQKRLQEATPLQPVVEAVAESAQDELTQAMALHGLGTLLQETGQYPEAWEKTTRALTLREKVLGREHPEVASSLQQLSAIAWWMGRYPLALENSERALALKKKALGPQHPEVVRAIKPTAIALRELGRYEESRQRFEQILVLQEKLLGPDHPDVSTALSNLSVVLLDLGRFEEARQYAERALALKEKLLGPDHLDLASPLINLGNALSELERHEQARQYHARALALAEKALGSDHPRVAQALVDLGTDLMNLGRYEEARQRLDRALALQEKISGKDHPDLAYVLSAQGELLLARGRPAEALPLLERAWKLASDGGNRAEIQFFLARALWQARKAERPRALKLATEARDHWQQVGQSTRQARISQWLAEHPSP